MTDVSVIHITSAHRRDDARIYRRYCRSLSFAKISVELIVCDNLPNSIEDGVQIQSVGTSTNSRVIRMFSNTLKIFLAVRKKQKSIIHFHDPELIPWALVLKLLGHKVVYDIHEDLRKQILIKMWVPQLLRKQLSKIFAFFEDFVCQYFDKIIVPQPSMFSHYSLVGNAELFPNYPFSKKVFHNRSDFRKSKYSIIYAGGITEERGLFNMLNLALALRKRNKNYRLILAGLMSDDLMLKATMHEGWKSVNYLGFIVEDELQRYLYSSSIGLILFNNIGQYYMANSLKLFEYMQAGLFVVMPNFGEWQKFNATHNVGINVAVNDHNSIADDIVKLSCQDFENASRNGKNAVKEHFLWEAQQDRLLAMYQEVAGK